jgi:hypothetical protein
MGVALNVAKLISSDERVELDNAALTGAHTTYAYTGFLAAEAVAFEISIKRLRSANVAVTIEGSDDDEETWTELEDLGELTHSGYVVVASPPDALRVTLNGTADVKVFARPLGGSGQGEAPPAGPTPDLATVLAEGNDADGATITGLDDPTGDQDAATKKYVDDNVPASGIPQGGPLTEDLDADDNKITGLADPISDQDAATKAYADSLVGSQPLDTVVDIEETPGAGVYRYELQVPANTWVELVTFQMEALWDADTVRISIGDSDDPGGFANNYLFSPTVDQVHWWLLDVAFYHTSQDLEGHYQKPRFYPDGDTITLTVTTTGAGGSTGRAKVILHSHRFEPATATATKLDGAIASASLLQGGNSGAILTSELAAGGLGYAPGDTGTLDGGNGEATYTVDTVDEDGAVLTYTLTAPGDSYPDDASVGTLVSTGAGDGGFSVQVNSVAPGYQVGDTGTIDGGDGNATYEIDTVDGDGNVLTFSVSTPGTGYSETEECATIGTVGPTHGFNLIVDTIT